MRKILLPPDAFDDYPEERGWSAEPDDPFADSIAVDDDDGPPDGDFADYAERVEQERRYDDGERFAGLLAAAERSVMA